MPTFIYNPSVQVYIETTDKVTGEIRTIDVSGDLISGSLTRRTNAPSSFTFTLQNAARKYDYPRPIFSPNDRIIVNMKRIRWVRVFTGYLNQVPIFSVWPKDVTLTASCSLKRLQYFYWDPNLPIVNNLISSALYAGKGAPDADGGIKEIFMAVVDQVVGWDKQKVHIGAIPKNWFDFALPIAQDEIKDSAARAAAAATAMAAVGASSTINGVTGVGAAAPTTALINGISLPATIGKCSRFGPPNDASTAGRPMANGELIDSATPYFCAMRWAYTKRAPQGILKNSGFYFDNGGKRIVVTNPTTGASVVVRAADWGPGSGGDVNLKSADSRVIDLDFTTMRDLGVSTDDVVNIGWAVDQSHSLGPVVRAATDTANSPTSATYTSYTTNNATLPAVGTASGADLVSTAVSLVTSQNVPYSESAGGTHLEILTSLNPNPLDCSSFIQWVYLHTVGSLQPAGVTGQIPRTTQTQWSWAVTQNKAARLDSKTALGIPGAILVNPGKHTEMSVGDGMNVVGAHHSGVFASVRPSSAGEFQFGFLLPGVHYTDAKGAYITGSSIGTTTYANGATGNQSVGTSVGNTIVDPGGNNPIDKLFASASWIYYPNDLSGNLYTGEAGLLNDEPVFPYLNNLMNASMRAWCSGPNGDIIGWFPDYFGVWGTAAIMTIEDIELMDFSVSWSDEQLITHQFVVGAFDSGISAADGTIQGNTQNDFATKGIASVEQNALISALFGAKISDADIGTFRDHILTRYGARPVSDTLPGFKSDKTEFFMALYLFMQRWAAQFTAEIPMTFMPEIWPGMLVQLKSYQFQAYVNEVTHAFQFGPSGSFTTQVSVIAPTNIGENSLYFSLPHSPTYIAGHGYTAADNAPVHENPHNKRGINVES